MLTQKFKAFQKEQQYKNFQKLPAAILCNGLRDALHLASLGYYPLWLGSETSKLTEEQYGKIMQCVEELYIPHNIALGSIRTNCFSNLKVIDLAIMIAKEEKERTEKAKNEIAAL